MKLVHNKELSTHACTVETMSQECFNHINDYISQFNVIGENKEETEKNIKNLPYFISGCFTYLQAEAFANYYHK